MTKYNKTAREHYSAYLKSTSHDLYDVYSSYSIYKARAYNRCRDLMLDMNGWGLRILSHNSQAFTVGFEYPDSETGEICFAYITKDYDRFTTL